MSSPLDRAFGPDEPSAYAPKWVREPAHAERRRPEGAGDAVAKGDHQSEPIIPVVFEEEMPCERYPIPRSLEPTLVPEPTWPTLHPRPSAGLLVRFAGAAAVAAVIAAIVVGRLPGSLTILARGQADETPASASRAAGQRASAVQVAALSPEARDPAPILAVSQDGPRAPGEPAPVGVALSAASPGAMLVVDGLPFGSTLNVGRATGVGGWRLMADDLPQAVIRPPQDFVGPMDLEIELRLADDSVADRKTLHAEWVAPAPPLAQSLQSPPRPAPPRAPPAAALQPAAPPVSAPAQRVSPAFVTRQLDPDEVAALLKRGEDFIATGDLASARLVLQRAAEAGEVRAALALAGTYDPNVLEKLGVQGQVADVALARAWYERARASGSLEAPRRLEQLASRTNSVR